MNKLSKLMLPLAGGIIVLMLVLANAALVSAAPPAPTAPAPTACADCQAEQDDLEAAYVDLEAVVADITAQSDQIEPMLSALDPVVAADQLALITDGQKCDTPGNTFRYYSSFTFDTDLYCFNDEAEYDDFFTSVIAEDPANDADWTTIMDTMLDLLTDADTDPDDIEDMMTLIDSLLVDLSDCEVSFCPVPVTCTDCEKIAADLQTEMDDLAGFKDDADMLYTAVTDFETQIDGSYLEFDQLQLLQDEFTQIVEGADGMTDTDCDNFQLDPGQTWGTVNNFSNVQWCFDSDGKMKDLAPDLQDYWQNNSADHLPADATLSQELDTLMNDYITKLDEYETALDDIDNSTQDIDKFDKDLDNCLKDLATSTDPGMCTDFDVPTMEGMVDTADILLNADGYLPQISTTTPPPTSAFPDTLGHWADSFIQELKDAGVVSGDGGTGLFRPNGPLNRAEAAKITPLAKGDSISICNPSYFPDVFVIDWYCKYVSTSQENGYFEGYGDGSFQPANLILRAEAVAVVMRATGFTVPNYTTYSFPDVQGFEWYADYTEKAFKCGIIEGRLVGSQKLFVGADNITRAEFAKIVNLAIFNVLLESDCAL